MMNRSIRRLAGRIAIGGVLFAQMAMVAYAVPVPPDRAAVVAAASGSAPDLARGHCAGMPSSPASAPPNVCEVHCTDGAVLPAPPDLPPVVLTALPVELLLFTPFDNSRDRGRILFAALAGAPPPSLEFCRLLI
jgi:hypothetical protein